MKKRNLLAVFVLSIITLGIYDLVWLVKTKKELNAKTRIHVPSIWLLFVPLIVFVASLIAFLVVAANNSSTTSTTNSYGYYATTTTTTNTNNVAAGAGILFIVYVLAIIVWICISFYWFFKFSKAVNEYTNGKMSTALTFLLLWILHLIGVVFVQDAFNDMIDAGTIPGEPMSGPGPQPIAPNSQPPVTPAGPVSPAGPNDFQPMQPSPSPQPVAPQAPTVSGPMPEVISPTVPTEPTNTPPQPPAGGQGPLVQ